MKQLLPFLAAYLRPYRGMIILSTLLAIAAAVFDTLIPIIYGRALDAVIEAQPLTVLGLILLIWLVLRLVTDTLRRFMLFHGQRIAQKASASFETFAFAKLLAFPVSFHTEQKSGTVREAVNWLRNDLHNFLARGLFDLVPGLLTILVITVYLFYLHPALGFANVVMLILLFAHSLRILPRFDAAWEKMHDARQSFFSGEGNIVGNIQIVKMNTSESYVRKHVDSLKKKWLKFGEGADRVGQEFGRGQDIIIGVGTVALFGIVALGIRTGEFTAGSIVTVMGFAFLTWAMTRQFLWVTWELLGLKVDHQKFFELFDRDEESFGTGKKIDIQGSVRFEHVAFQYQAGKNVLKDVQFSVDAGEVVAIVGESGQGKTTLMELLYRFYSPQKGAILIDGIDIHDFELKHLRSQLAYVPQDLSLFHETIEKNIRYGRLNASDKEVRDAAKMAALHDWLMKLPKKYDSVVGERGLKLSAGERQRIALARAFLRDPKILVLDEPTSNLDAKTELLIQRSLKELMKGRTTFIIAHRLRTVQEADKILVLQGGQIVEIGTHSELLQKKGAYSELHALQFQASSPA